MLPIRKSDQVILKSDFYQTIFTTINQTKSKPKLAMFEVKIRHVIKLDSDIKCSNFFVWKRSMFMKVFKFFLALCERLKEWKSDYLAFSSQEADFSGKKRTNLGAYFQKGLMSDQGLIKRTYLAALLRLNKTTVVCLVVFQYCLSI